MFAVAASAAAQTVTGTLQGTVTDTSGGVLPGVTITVTHVETGTQRALVTNGEGIYNAPFLQIGRYTVKAELSGFGTVIREGVDIRLNDTRVVDIKPRCARHAGSHRNGADRGDQYDERRSQGIAHRRADHGQAVAQREQLPFARRDVHRLPGQSHERAEQPDRLVRVFDQLQRYRHARRDVSDQRRQQRRLV